MKGAKRAVRWKDDTEDGALAEYKTPQKFTPSPLEDPTVELPVLPSVSELSSFAQRMEDATSPQSSPIPSKPEPTLSIHSKNDRFKAGFLSRKTEGSPDTSTISAAPQANNFSSSDTEQSPLREWKRDLANRRSSKSPPVPDLQDEEVTSANSSDVENQDPERLSAKDAMKIGSAVKRSSSIRTSGISKTHRRRSPTAATTASPPATGDMFGAGHVRRMVMPPPTKADIWKAGVLSPRVDGITTHHRVASGSSRRTTMTGVADNDRPQNGQPRGMSVGERAALRLSNINHGNTREKENMGFGSGGVRTSLMPGSKNVWR